jgi:hypothetical protein
MIMGLTLFNFFLFPLIATSIAMPGIVNPISDLFPGFAQGPSGIGAGTGSGPPGTDTIKPSTDNIQSCLVGIGTGFVIGGAVGLVVASPFTALGGAIIAGIAGCGVASTFFPAQGASIFNSFTNAAGPIGDFAKALAAALAWVGPILKFFQDMVAYEFVLLVSAPEIGAFLFPFQATEALILVFVAAEYIRGTGIGA